MPAKSCSTCGAALSKYNGKTGLCRPCFLKTGASRRGRGMVERGVCHCCRRVRLIPDGKDPRWFRCAACDAREADGGEWCDSHLGF